jgi:hypothetical protein
MELERWSGIWFQFILQDTQIKINQLHLQLVQIHECLII